MEMDFEESMDLEPGMEVEPEAEAESDEDAHEEMMVDTIETAATNPGAPTRAYRSTLHAPADTRAGRESD